MGVLGCHRRGKLHVKPVPLSECACKMLLRSLIVSVLFAASVSPLFSQALGRRFTRPAIPQERILKRLQLELAWTVRLPTEGQKDGIASFQVLPNVKGDEVLVQTYSGLVMLLDAEKGDVKWRVPVGLPFTKLLPAAYNDETIFVTRGNWIFALNRKNGYHKLYTIERRTGAVTLGAQLEYAPSAMPTADPVAVFIPTVNRVSTYLMNFYEGLLELPPVNPAAGLPDTTVASAPPPKLANSRLFLGVGSTKPLVLAKDRIAFLSDDGTLYSINRFTLATIFTFKARGAASVPLGHYEDMVYFGSNDFTLYAIDLNSGEVFWRYLSGGIVTRQPIATEKDVFVVASSQGLARVDRGNGHRKWLNPDADHFLSTNGKFVYATDRRGYFLVIDYERGRTLARYDLRDYVVRVANRWSDRVFLAAHDGRIICLRHRDLVRPYRPIPLPENRATPQTKKKE